MFKNAYAFENLLLSASEMSHIAVLLIIGVKKKKQPLEVFCKRRCSSKFHAIHRKAPAPKSLF